MTTPAFIILVLLFILVIWIYVEMAKYPGKKDRGHPQAEAINVLSWVGLLFGAVPWVVALVWAHTNPSGPAVRFAPATEPSALSKVQDEEEEPK